MIVGTSTTTSIRLVVTGSEGRMSSALRAVSRKDQRFVLLETMGFRGCAKRKSQGENHPDNVDVIVDFTTEEGTAFALQIASQESCAFLVGTTGLSRNIIDKIENFAAEHPVMIAPNTSLGAVVMRFLVSQTARILQSRCHIDLVERHHMHKRDAPSGTAIRLVESIREKSGIEIPPERVHSIRAGDICGEHEVEFSCPGERLKILHTVTDRRVFALGALDAAAWLYQQPPGLHTLEEFLGIES